MKSPKISASPTQKKKQILLSPFDSYKPDLTNNERQPSAFKEQFCLKHSQEYSSLCFSCGESYLCQECFTQHNKQHDTKSMEKSIVFIENQLEEYSIRLSNKDELLSLYHKQCKDNLDALYSQSRQYRASIDRQFADIAELIEEKRQNLLQQIDIYYQNYQERVKENLQEIRERKIFIQQLRRSIQNVHESPTEQIDLYITRKDFLSSMTKEEDLIPFKNNANLNVQYYLQMDLITELKKILDQIDVQIIEESTRVEKKRIKKNIHKLSIDPDLTYINPYKSKDKQFSAVWTPQNNQSKQKLKKSRQVGSTLQRKNHKSRFKMTSMPASPIKEKKEGMSKFIEEEFSKKKITFKKKR